jgi:hypothetical protein
MDLSKPKSAKVDNHFTTTSQSHDMPSLRMGEPYADIYCRGCHAQPSYKNINSYFCIECWKVWNGLRRASELLDPSEVETYKQELTEFIKARGRYVWHSETYLYFRPVSRAELKRHNIAVAQICQNLGLLPPANDRITIETIQRVKDYSTDFHQKHGKMPSIRQLIKGAKLDYDTLTSFMDYAEFAGSFGTRIHTNIRHRFQDDNDFKQQAAQIVREEGCALQMTFILDQLGVSYPSYLTHFSSVSPEDIHDLAGVSRDLGYFWSLNEVAAKKALANLGREVEPQVSFPDLVGDGGRPLLYDLRVVGTNVLVEVDGPQHYDPKNTFYKASTAKYDKMKDAYAQKNGFPLIRVDVRRHKDIPAMTEFFRHHPFLSSLNPSNALNTTGPARRKIKRGLVRDRPGPR